VPFLGKPLRSLQSLQAHPRDPPPLSRSGKPQAAADALPVLSTEVAVLSLGLFKSREGLALKRQLRALTPKLMAAAHMHAMNEHNESADKKSNGERGHGSSGEGDGESKGPKSPPTTYELACALLHRLKPALLTLAESQELDVPKNLKSEDNCNSSGVEMDEAQNDLSPQATTANTTPVTTSPDPAKNAVEPTPALTFSASASPTSSPGGFQFSASSTQLPASTTSGGGFQFSASPTPPPANATSGGGFQYCASPTPPPANATSGGGFQFSAPPTQPPANTTSGGGFQFCASPTPPPANATSGGGFQFSAPPTQPPANTTSGGGFHFSASPTPPPANTASGGGFQFSASPMLSPANATGGEFNFSASPMQSPANATGGEFNFSASPMLSPANATGGEFNFSASPMQSPANATGGEFNFSASPTLPPATSKSILESSSVDSIDLSPPLKSPESCENHDVMSSEKVEISRLLLALLRRWNTSFWPHDCSKTTTEWRRRIASLGVDVIPRYSVRVAPGKESRYDESSSAVLLPASLFGGSQPMKVASSGKLTLSGGYSGGVGLIAAPSSAPQPAIVPSSTATPQTIAAALPVEWHNVAGSEAKIDGPEVCEVFHTIIQSFLHLTLLFGYASESKFHFFLEKRMKREFAFKSPRADYISLSNLTSRVSFICFSMIFLRPPLTPFFSYVAVASQQLFQQVRSVYSSTARHYDSSRRNWWHQNGAWVYG